MEPVRSYWYESYRRYWYRVLQARKHPDYRLSLSWVCGFFGTIILLGSAYTAGSAINTVWTDSILNCDLLFSLNATCPYSTVSFLRPILEVTHPTLFANSDLEAIVLGTRSIPPEQMFLRYIRPLKWVGQ